MNIAKAKFARMKWYQRLVCLIGAAVVYRVLVHRLSPPPVQRACTFLSIPDLEECQSLTDFDGRTTGRTKIGRAHV